MFLHGIFITLLSACSSSIVNIDFKAGISCIIIMEVTLVVQQRLSMISDDPIPRALTQIYHVKPRFHSVDIPWKQW